MAHEGDSAHVCVVLLNGKLGTEVVLSIDIALENDSGRSSYWHLMMQWNLSNK